MKNVRILWLCVFVALGLVTVIAHAQTFSVLYDFGTKSGDPLQPAYSGIVAQGRDGSLYSTTPSGGTGHGTVFKVSPAGGLTVLHNFTGLSEGNTPYGGLTLGADGNFYGAASGGGTCCGTIFKITPKGVLTVLHTFGTDGAEPLAPPIQGSDGNFYGTTAGGVVGAPFGTVYKISSSGKFKLLHLFADATEGGYPFAPLVQGTDRNFYGTTTVGGTHSGGTVFKITPSGVLSVVFNFDIAVGGVTPIAPLIQASDGNFYGTTFGGGGFDQGTVFRLTSIGTMTIVHSFNFTGDGGKPESGLVEGTDGNFYGAARDGGASGFGTLYMVTPGGIYNVLHTFDSTAGAYPDVTVMQHTNGNLFGDTIQGGTGANGVFYGLGNSLGAFVSLVTRAGKVGKVVGILGQGFKGATAVSFNGTLATTFKVVTGTYMTVTVPAGASTGPVIVSTPGGALVSNNEFLVIP